MEMRKNAQGALDHQVLDMALSVQRDIDFLKSHGVYSISGENISVSPEMFRRMFPSLAQPRRIDQHTSIMDAVYHGQRITSYIHGDL
jgi:hypothetical protein